MPSPAWIRISIYVCAALLVAAALALGIPLDEELGRLFGIAASVTVLVLGAFERWSWRWLPESVVGRPDLNGTWRAQLNYEWPKGNPQSKPCFLVIRQRYSRISSIDLLTDEQTSHSTSAGLVSEGGQTKLAYTYRSEPQTRLQHRSPTHRGSAVLTCHSQPKKLAGDYWTERLSKGHIETGGHSTAFHSDFGAAGQDTYSGAAGRVG